MSTSSFVHVNRPVNRTEYFIGREKITNYIINNIKEAESIYYALIGELGMGKTSVLNYLRFKETQEKNDIPDNILFVMVDPLDRVTCGEDFYRYIGESILDAATKKRTMGPELVDYIQESVERMYDYTRKRLIEKTLTALLEELTYEKYKVVLMLDDFEKTVQTSNLDTAEFTYLRTLTSGINVNVSYIITSRKDLKFISDAANTSGFSYIFNATIPFSPLFSKEEVYLYIDKYASDKQLTNEQKDEIYIISGGVPALLKWICSKVLQQDNYGQDIDISRLTLDILWDNSAYLESIVEKNDNDIKTLLNEHADKREKEHSKKRLETIGLLKHSDGSVQYSSPIFEMYITDWWKRESLLLQNNQPAKIEHTELLETNNEYSHSNFTRRPNESSLGSSQAQDLLRILLEAVKYGRDTHEEDIGKKVEQTIQSMEGRLTDKMDLLSERFIQVSGEIVRTVSQLQASYLSPANEDISEYASKIREQVTLLLNDDEGFLKIKEIPAEIQAIWEVLEHESREYIMIGEVLHHIFETESMDLSPISICYCRAFELEMNKKMLPFLKKHAGQVEIKIGTRNFPINDSKIDSMMLGAFNFVLVKSPASFMLQNEIKKLGIDVSQFLTSFNTLKDIRNRTAHADRIEAADLNLIKEHLFGAESNIGVLRSLMAII